MRRAWLVLIVGWLMVAGCSTVEAPALGPTATPTPQADTAGLLQKRRAAGIPDCPAGDAGFEAAPGGLPDVSLDCLGESSSLRLSELHGKPYVINVWASWCGPCREESGHLRRFAARAGDRVGMLGVLYTEPDPASAIEFAQAAGWTWPHLVDATQASAAGLKVAGVPTTVFVRADGRAAYVKSGAFASEDEIVAAVREHLGVDVP